MSGWKQQVLLLSLLLNVAMVVLFLFFVVRDHPHALPYRPIKEQALSLLEQIRRQPEERLVQQFIKSSEFVLIQTLLSRTEHEVARSTILKLLLEGNQEIFTQFIEQQRAGSDLSPRCRQEFLMEYVNLGSKTAAYLLVTLDLEFALLLSNASVEHLLLLMDEPTPEAISFVEAILEEKRTPAVHQRALRQLASYKGSPLGEVAARYDPFLNTENLRPVIRQQVPITQTERTHIVQPGESLWLIARRYHVDMRKLMVINELYSTTLQPGQMLKIPFPEE